MTTVMALYLNTKYNCKYEGVFGITMFVDIVMWQSLATIFGG
jgi:hypothetical protein